MATIKNAAEARKRSDNAHKLLTLYEQVLNMVEIQTDKGYLCVVMTFSEDEIDLGIIPKLHREGFKAEYAAPGEYAKASRKVSIEW